MTTPVRLRIRSLEDRRNVLNHEILEHHLGREDRNRVEAEIRAATMAVYHYRSAAKSEKSVLLPPPQ